MERDMVILPCAGAGTRLQLPYPKELLAVAPGRVLIDYTFDLLSSHSDHILVAVVIGPGKLETVRYLQRYQERFEMAFLYQKPDLTDATGAVLSAAPWFGDRNLVLLPDQILYPDPAIQDPVGAAFEALAESPFCFIATLEDDTSRIAQDGALRLVNICGKGDRVVDFADKPGPRADGFNAVWAGFGFRRQGGTEGVCLMRRSAIREPVTRTDLERSPLDGCPAVLVRAYEDLGTWPRIQHFWATGVGGA